MLYQLGALPIKVAPFNVDQVSRSTSADWAEKAVLGAEPSVEFVGGGPQTFQLEGTLLPAKLGGLPELKLLDEMLASGLPQFLMRGDGIPLGWMVITSVDDTSTYLDREGVGQVVKVSISLRRGRKPPAGSFFSILSGFFR